MLVLLLLFRPRCNFTNIFAQNILHGYMIYMYVYILYMARKFRCYSQSACQSNGNDRELIRPQPKIEFGSLLSAWANKQVAKFCTIIFINFLYIFFFFVVIISRSYIKCLDKLWQHTHTQQLSGKTGSGVSVRRT